MQVKKWMFWALVALAAIGAYYLVTQKAGISISRTGKAQEDKEPVAEPAPTTGAPVKP